MFKFRSGTHGLNEELCKQRGRRGERSPYCVIVNVRVWYSTLRNDFRCKLQELLGDIFEHFESLDSLKKHLLSWVVSCGRLTLSLCSIMLRFTWLTVGS